MQQFCTCEEPSSVDCVLYCSMVSNFQTVLGLGLALLNSLSAEDFSAFCAMRSISSCIMRSFSLIMLT